MVRIIITVTISLLFFINLRGTCQESKKEETVNNIINHNYMKRTGLKYLYHRGSFNTWSHFKLDKKAFPGNWESMKRCVEKAKAQDVRRFCS